MRMFVLLATLAVTACGAATGPAGTPSASNRNPVTGQAGGSNASSGGSGGSSGGQGGAAGTSR